MANKKIIAGVAAATAAAGIVAATRRKGASAPSATYHVRADDGEWVVRAEGAERAASRHRTKKEFNKATNTETEVDASEIDIKSPQSGDAYTLVSGKPQFEKDIFVRFIYLRSRTNPRLCPQFVSKKGVEFTLKHRSGVSEKYVVSELTRESVKVKRLDLPPDADPATAETPVEKLDERRDFFRRRTESDRPY